MNTQHLLDPLKCIAIDYSEVQSDIESQAALSLSHQPQPLPPNHILLSKSKKSLLQPIKLRRKIKHKFSTKNAPIKIENQINISDQQSVQNIIKQPPVQNQLSLVQSQKIKYKPIKKQSRKIAIVSNKVKLQGQQQHTKQCAICLCNLQKLKQRFRGRLQCGHIFCMKCIKQSSKFSNKCPYCRSVYTKITNKYTTIKVSQPIPHDYDDPNDQPCYICGHNDNFSRLLVCDFCQFACCHTYCDSRLNSSLPPANQWYCISCEELLQRRQLQLRNI